MNEFSKAFILSSQTEYAMKRLIKRYFERLESKLLGLRAPIKVCSVKKLGMGAGNLNYAVLANGERFVFRMNIDLTDKNKSRREFTALKAVEKYSVGPKAWLLDTTRKMFDGTFIIIDYIEGTPLNLRKTVLTPKLITALARLSAQIHAIKITPALRRGLGKGEFDYQNYLEQILARMRHIRKYMHDHYFLKMMTETYKRLQQHVPDYPGSTVVITQGDFCQQNVIVHNGKLRLIDFESLELTDAAAELAHIFVDFGKELNTFQQELFLREYLRIRKDETLRERIKVYVPLKRFNVFLWAVEHALKIKHREMHTKFLEHADIKNQVQYTKFCFKNALRADVISKSYSKIDIGKLISKH